MNTQMQPQTDSHCPTETVLDTRDVLWEALRNRKQQGIPFRRDQLFGGVTADFFSPSYHLVINVNNPGVGSAHWAYAKCDAQLRHMGFRVLRFTYDEAHGEKQFVLDSIVEVVSQIARRRTRY